jgi:hypothetical protein
MRTTVFHAQALAKLFKKQKVATLQQLKQALGTDVEMTVFRKLKLLDYLSSYSHRGGFYTLPGIPKFDHLGLVSIRGVRFSRFGTLQNTVFTLVRDSDQGYFADELRQLLHVEVKEVLRTLVQQNRLIRERVGMRFWYAASDPAVQQRQRLARRFDERPPDAEVLTPVTPVSDKVKAALVLFVSLLDEKQRRLYAGLESLRLGPGGDRKIAELLGVHSDTVARGRRELLGGDIDSGRVRRAGGGRKALKKKRPKSSQRSGSC